MRPVRLLLRDTRALCPTSPHPGSHQRCLASMGSLAGATESPGREYSSHTSSTTTTSPPSRVVMVGVTGVIASGLCLAWYFHGNMEEKEGHLGNHRSSLPSVLPQLRAAEQEKDEKPPKVSVRERRYKAFSSISYRGEPYMTPRDFLESVTIDEPRRKQ